MTALTATFEGTADSQVRQSFHIVHGVLSLELGGLERLVVDLVKKGRQRGHRVTVVCIEQLGKLASQVEELGATTISLEKPTGRCEKTVEIAGEVLQSLRPDIIHTHQIGALWYLGRAARQAGSPVLHTEHSDHVRLARGLFQKLRMRYRWRQMAPFAHRFCCVSEDIARSVCRWGTVPKAKVDIVPNGIDTERYGHASCGAAIRASLEIPPGALVIGTVGRLVEVKRQDLLIRAFAALQGQGKHAGLRLLIVGDGEERTRLEKLAFSLGVGERTIFAGYQAQPENYLQAMDLFALTSRHEGLPLALLEAWATGLCVVSSAVGAIPQTVSDGVNGVLFPSGNRQGLTDALARLLEDPELMGRLGRAGRHQVQQKYSLDQSADAYEQRYRSLITH